MVAKQRAGTVRSTRGTAAAARRAASIQRRLAAFFHGRRRARRLFEAVVRAASRSGPVSLEVTKSQIAFADGRAFAWAWTPDRWLSGDLAPLVLSVALRRHDRSPRWKQVVQPRRGWWVHHLELRAVREVNGEVAAWLREARGAPPSSARRGDGRHG